MKHDETSTTTSYSDVHPRETTSIHARVTVVTVVVSSQRCDGCDGESRRGTWGLVALTLGNANSSRSQEISPAQIKYEQVLPVSWSSVFAFWTWELDIEVSSQSHRLLVKTCRSWQLDGWKSTALDRPPMAVRVWLGERVKCSGSRAGFGFLWLWTYNLDNLGTSRAPIPRYFTGYSPSHFKGHISLWKYHCWFSCGVMPGYATRFLGNVTALQVTAWSGLVFCALDQQSIVGWGSLSWTDPRLIFSA